jgi:hypothetical protein
MSLNLSRKMLRMARLFLYVCFLVSAAVSVKAQYPGKVNEPKKEEPGPRSVAVLEWTGETGKPKASRLIPVTVFNEGTYQDGGLYMARPAPLALIYDTLYELQTSGIPNGSFAVTEAGRLGDSWFGYGTWQPLKPPSLSKPMESRLTPEVVIDADDDKPHLKRHPGSDAPEDAGKPGANTSSSSSTQKTQDQKKSQANAPPPDDPDRPHLRKRPKSEETPTSSEAGVEAMAPSVSNDPDRPKLHRGQPQQTIVAAEKLTGTPAGLHQEVAVSDSFDRPQHGFSYAWTNAEEETAARSALEKLAWQEITPKSVAPPKAKVSRTTKRRTAVAPETPVPQPKFAEEQFKAFELAYGSGATMVFFGRTEGEGSAQHFVTLIAETDLYGTPHVLLKQITDGSHLDATPQMRLIDAVDADGDNRGELLFELRSPTQRQFAIYRVTRGRTEQLFATAALP